MRNLALYLFLLLSVVAYTSSAPKTENEKAVSVDDSIPEAKQLSPFIAEILPGAELLREKAQPKGNTEGVLLGFYADNTYFTRYYLIENGKVTQTLHLPYLVTPQKDDFHFIQEMIVVDSIDRDMEFDPDYPFLYHYFKKAPMDFSGPKVLLEAVAAEKKHRNKPLSIFSWKTK